MYKIKPLKWEFRDEVYFSNKIYGTQYIITDYDNIWEACYWDGKREIRFEPEFKTSDEAKAFCQQHFENEIKKYLIEI